MDVRTVITMVGSFWQVKKEVVQQLIETDVGSEEKLEALVCIHDGIQAEEVIALLQSGVAIETLMELRKKIPEDTVSLKDPEINASGELEVAEEMMVAGEIRPVKKEYQTTAPEAAVTLAVAGEVVEKTEVDDKAIPARLRHLFFRMRPVLTEEERFREYANLISDDMSEGQQIEIINAINAELPYDVVKIIAKKERSAAVMRYMAAAYLHMTRGKKMEFKEENAV